MRSNKTRCCLKVHYVVKPLCMLLIIPLLLPVSFILLPGHPQPAHAASYEPVEEAWVTNGYVNSIVTEGATTYIGGSFSYVGPNTGYGVPFDMSDGNPMAVYPKANKAVLAVASDGSGGWFIGGDFTVVEGVARNRIAHILADGTLDSAWNPFVGYGSVLALATSGTTLYAGGGFTADDGSAYSRNHLAAIDIDPASASYGKSISWNPNVSGTVYALAITGSTLYAGGKFTTLGGGTYARNRLAAIDINPASASYGQPTSWNPNASNYVRSLAISGSTLYAGGDFTTLGGGTYARNHLAAIDIDPASASYGQPTSWNPNASNYVRSLAISGSTLYAGGDFTTLGGGTYARNHLAAIDIDPASASYGQPTSWNPNASGGIYSMALSNSILYVGGYFKTFNGGVYPRNNLAAIDIDPASASYGQPTSWDPSASSTVYALGVSGSILYAGNGGRSFGGKVRNNLAAIDTDTASATYGQATAWDPSVNGTVYALVLSGTALYTGGHFSTLGGGTYTRNNLAAIDTDPASSTYGQPASWDPNVDDYIRSLVLSGSTLYAGGYFSTLGGGAYTRNNLAAINADPDSPAYGQATSWNPNVNSAVYALAISGSALYAGGDFTTLGGGTYARNRLAAIDTDPASATYGQATAWDPNMNGTVNALVLSGSTLYAGGGFTTLGGSTYARNRLAAIDIDPASASYGQPASWNPNLNNYVYALALSGSTLYAGGGFTALGGYAYSRNRLAAIDIDPASASYGQPTSWNPDLSTDSLTVSFSLALSGATLYLGGQFYTVGGNTRGSFAVFQGSTVIASVDNGHGIVDPISQQVAPSATATVDLLPDEHYHVDSVTDNGTTVTPVPAGSYTISNVIEDHSIVATFAVDTNTLSTTTVGSGTITLDPPTGTYDYGTSVGLTAVPATGWHFTGWSGDLSGSQNPESILMDADKSVTATFAVDTNTLSTTTVGSGTITLDPPTGTYDYGTSVGLTAVPATGWHFTGWSGDLSGSQNPESILMDADKSVTATFAVDTHTITASCGIGGSITPSGQVAVGYNADQAFTIIPDAGYHVFEVWVDGVSVGAVPSYAFSNVTSDHTIEASFAADESPGATWYLAEGCTDGGMETWVLVQNALASEVTVDLILQTSSGEQRPAGLQGQVIPAASRRSFNLGAFVTDYDVSTKVSATGGEVVCERSMYGNGNSWGHDSVGTNTPTTTWYLAEGCTDGHMETWVLVQNPGAEDVTVDLTLQTGAGERKPEGLQGVTVPANTRRSFNLNDYVTDYQVSTTVTSSGPVVCERSMYGPGKTWGTNSIGVTSPSATWYLAEGCTYGHMDTWVLVQNPGTAEVTVDLTLMTSSGELKPEGLQGVVIQPGTRRTFRLNDFVTDYDVSTRVSASGGEVVCERSMYGNGNSWGHDSIGVTATAATWCLAEGCTDGQVETWVLVQNPDTAEVTVDLTLMTSSGELKPEGLQGVVIQPGTRRTFRLNDYVTDYDVSTRVDASGGVVCERAMYGPGHTWSTGSIGWYSCP